MGKKATASCDNKDGLLKKGPWTAEEDKKLLDYIERHGHGSWRALPEKAGLQRCGKSCRLRWRNYLRPDIKRGKFSWQEEQTIIQLHALLGNRWSTIANMVPKRTDNEIKNHWNTHLKKRLLKMGIDPITHKPKINALIGSDNRTRDVVGGVNANLINHIAQWESARVEAEARLVKESRQIKSSSFSTNNPYNYHHQLRIISATTKAEFRPLPPLSSSYLNSKQPLFIPPPCLDHIFKARNDNQSEWKNPNHHVLESPTSCLQFSDNLHHRQLPITTAIPSPVTNHVKKILNVNPPEKVVASVAAAAAAADEDSSSLGVPSFMEDDDHLNILGDLISWNHDDADQEVFNITGIYDNNVNLGSSSSGGSGFCTTGNLEDNVMYWNTNSETGL